MTLTIREYMEMEHCFSDASTSIDKDEWIGNLPDNESAWFMSKWLRDSESDQQQVKQVIAFIRSLI